MKFTDGAYLPEEPVEHIPDERSVEEATERIEPFLKGQGYFPIKGSLKVLNATVEEAHDVLELIFRLSSQSLLDDRCREQLRDQADKDRVALSHALKKNEALEESNRRLVSQIKELESKLLAAKHKAEEQERELKQKLQSTTARLNGYLNGGRDAGKRTVAGTGGVGGVASAGGPRRVAPAYDRFRDDPVEAAAVSQKLEAELSQLRQQKARLKKQLATAREQLGASPRGAGSGDSPNRDGRRGDQQLMVQQGDTHEQSPNKNYDMHAMRASLTDANGSDLCSNEVMRFQRLVRELQLTSEQQQRQLEKAAADRSELLKTLGSLRSRCANLEVERKNAEDRVLRAQRATAALLEPAAAEALVMELRAKLMAYERELMEAGNRADALQQRLSAAEIELESNQRHVGVLKRAIRALPRGLQVLNELDQLVAEELQPLRDRLRDAVLELEVARAQHATATRGDQSGISSTVIPGCQPTSCVGIQPASDGLPLSPTMPLHYSPGARFNGFGTRPGIAAYSPQLLMQASPAHGGYSRAYSITMPSERLMMGCSSPIKMPGDVVQQLKQQDEPSGVESVHRGGAQAGDDVTLSSTILRRSISAGVGDRICVAYASADRQRARWQVHNPMVKERFPSPIDIILEQARNQAADTTISIAAPTSGIVNGTTSE